MNFEERDLHIHIYTYICVCMYMFAYVRIIDGYSTWIAQCNLHTYKKDYKLWKSWI